MGRPLEFRNFSESEYCEEEEMIETLGKEKWEGILSIAKKRNWQPDDSLSTHISSGGSDVAVLITFSDGHVIIESGHMSDDSERYAAHFEGGGVSGMPEIEKMINNIVESCIRKQKPALMRKTK